MTSREVNTPPPVFIQYHNIIYFTQLKCFYSHRKIMWINMYFRKGVLTNDESYLGVPHIKNQSDELNYINLTWTWKNLHVAWPISTSFHESVKYNFKWFTKNIWFNLKQSIHIGRIFFHYMTGWNKVFLIL